MIYRFRILSDEVDHFIRDIEIDGKQTFHELHLAIQKNLAWDETQMASFFISNEEWEKLREITLFEMDMEGETDSVVMDVSVIEEFVNEEKQRLLYVFDIFTERLFFIELSSIFEGDCMEKLPKIVLEKGEAPEQISFKLDDPPMISENLYDFDVEDDEDVFSEEDRIENIDDYDL